MLAKSCLTSQGQPVSGSRNRAMISIMRASSVWVSDIKHGYQIRQSWGSEIFAIPVKRLFKLRFLLGLNAVRLH